MLQYAIAQDMKQGKGVAIIDPHGDMAEMLLRHVPPVAAMSPAFLIPLFGVTWGHLFLGEPLGSGVYLGGAFVLLATALVTGFNPLRRLWPAPPVA
jgi:hypothetical protein